MPMSPAPIVPSSASVIAWSATSASLWPLRAVAVGDADAAEPQLSARGEAVDVEALRGADAHRRRQPRLSGGEVGGVGDLLERRIAGDDRDIMPGMADHLRVVGRLPALGPGAMRGEHGLEAEGLRRLDTHQPLARDQLAVGREQGVGEREGRDGAVMAVEGRQQDCRSPSRARRGGRRHG